VRPRPWLRCRDRQPIKDLDPSGDVAAATNTPRTAASLLSINGTLQEGERYAIDFVQMTPQGKITEGSNKVLANYPFYGDEVLSATAGTVVGVQSGLPDGPIDFELPPGEAGDAGGNHVVVKVGPGIYSFYAHLVPGSRWSRSANG
jgi:hypothetical protein